ncbi:Predicted component of the ribosome quality control (RQC) complex, YloA/Tae2 family, contains fibronectin-binding (FbpA) and DUF814 domains [Cyclobacterium lianum]|uniref:Predicted component of the ribosome quality control (RQC) complex, YloA/Tae2 family, contains fibronectin-binding (FbpA) and DUF814 domains n=1 Tax=Cyclobacterium lianum TaxID=388280 RepID=A0A1M7N9W4_9BACT|nr:NFACT RNA binding domain-containing protein [Cyclobacterium lianum]SHN00277.1 Predicted component of the ribosome quality control (RQC) complex, YloA/Tae2 family, contains fibronectin-binding (FbpA) and DUF814 domains [Cyclobacterium lianum]
MHLNYHYFRFLCPALEEKIRGATLVSCFSQNKEELILELQLAENRLFFIRALLLPSNTCLSFPSDFKRSKKNNIDLFPEILHQKITGVHLLAFERAFYLETADGTALLFKMHGSRSNILLFETRDSLPVRLFRKELQEDMTIRIPDLEKPLDLSWSRFKSLEGNASQFLPTLGKLPRAWLKREGYLDAGLERRFELMQAVMDMLESPLFSVFKEEGKYLLTLLPCSRALLSTSDPLEAANAYYQKAVVQQAFDNKKHSLLRALSEQQKKTASYLQKTRQKLEALESAPQLSQTADIIMANLHQIPPGSERVQLFDFYANELREIQLKKGISPQQHAENLYRKSKNKKIELEQLRKNLEVREKQLAELNQEQLEIQQVDDFHELRAITKSEKPAGPGSKQVQLPYRKLEVEGFEIWIGKSARANDELLRRYTWKEDIWLHARDVAGSHVIIKQQSGMRVPAPVLERAASLAAYYSKNKTASLAAVIYTPCKFVRKVKGSPAGAVIVDREKVIMVSPESPDKL